MEIIFGPNAQNHLAFWKEGGDKSIMKKIEKLLQAMVDDPFEEIRKPDALRHDLSGFWSRRIN